LFHCCGCKQQYKEFLSLPNMSSISNRKDLWNAFLLVYLAWKEPWSLAKLRDIDTEKHWRVAWSRAALLWPACKIVVTKWCVCSSCSNWRNGRNSRSRINDSSLRTRLATIVWQYCDVSLYQIEIVYKQTEITHIFWNCILWYYSFMLFNELVHTLTLHLQKCISSFIKNISNKTIRSIYFCDKHNKKSMMIIRTVMTTFLHNPLLNNRYWMKRRMRHRQLLHPSVKNCRGNLPSLSLHLE